MRNIKYYDNENLRSKPGSFESSQWYDPNPTGRVMRVTAGYGSLKSSTLIRIKTRVGSNDPGRLNPFGALKSTSRIYPLSESSGISRIFELDCRAITVSGSIHFCPPMGIYSRINPVYKALAST